MNYTLKNIEEIESWLKDNLTEEKYLHSIGAMETSKLLAMKFNLDIEKAQERYMPQSMQCCSAFCSARNYSNT